MNFFLNICISDGDFVKVHSKCCSVDVVYSQYIVNRQQTYKVLFLDLICSPLKKLLSCNFHEITHFYA